MTGASSRSYNCNLELVGQFQGEGANYQMASFDECAYYGTASRPVQNKGVVVVDVSNPRRPVATTYLDARAMWDPWEILGGHLEQLQHSDVYTLRRIVPADRGLDIF